MKLTARSVKGLAVVDRPRIFFDSDLKGFGLRCRPPSSKVPEGSASWIVEYRPGGGGRKVAKVRYCLGSLALLDPSDARKRAKNDLAIVQAGGDPAAVRREARQAPTIAELVGDVRKPTEMIAEIVARASKADAKVVHRILYADKSLRPPAILAKLNDRGFKTERANGYHTRGSVNRKPRSLELLAGHWRIHLLPEIGGKKLRDITHAEVVKLHRKIGETHKATANRCVSLLRHFYGWAAKMGDIPAGMNPAKGVEMFKESASERYLTADELEALANAIIEAETIGIPWVPPKGAPSKHRAAREENRRSWIEPSAAAAIRLLLLTGARLREILHIRWTEVDFQRGTLRLSDSKTGPKSIVLGAAALQILENLRTTSNGEFVIAGAHPEKPRSDLNRPWALVCRKAGLTGVRLHDLRHTFAAVAASGGMGLPMIGRLLGHADTRTTQRYAHLANDAARRAADLVGTDIAAAMRGSVPARAPAYG